jgi:hypothetical protein
MFWALLLPRLSSAAGAALKFFTTKPGIYIAAAIAACLGLWWYGHLRYAAGAAAVTAATALRAAQTKAKQTAAISGANDRAAARAVEAAKKDAEIKEAVTNVKQAAAAMPDAGSVAITVPVADRLRELH